MRKVLLVYLWIFIFLRVYSVQCLYLEQRLDFEKRFGLLLPYCTTKFYNVEITPQDLTLVRLLVMRSEQDYTAYPLHDCARCLLADPHFNMSRQTVVYSHGFTQNATICPTRLVTKAYLSLQSNVLMIDSYPLLKNDYLKSVVAVPKIGRALGDQLFRMTESGFNHKDLVLVGHSLGSHIVGFAGKQFKDRSGKKLPTIVGLDPAGPCFLQVPYTERIDRTDAEFVQIVHTNAGYIGMMKPVGHVDFYPNGGQVQPTEIFIVPNPYTSHERSVELWYESIRNTDKLLGVECYDDSEVETHNCLKKGRRLVALGPKADRDAEGMFYLTTSCQPPFYLGGDIHIKSNDSILI